MLLFLILARRDFPGDSRNSSLGNVKEFKYGYLRRHAKRKHQPIGMSWQAICRGKLFQSNGIIGDKLFVVESLGEPSFVCSGLDLSKALAIAGHRQNGGYLVEQILWNQLAVLSDGGSMYRDHRTFRSQFLETDTELGPAECFVYFAEKHIIGSQSQISRLANGGYAFIIFFSEENVIASSGCQHLSPMDFERASQPKSVGGVNSSRK